MFLSYILRFFTLAGGLVAATGLCAQPLSEFFQSAARHNPSALSQKYNSEKMDSLYQGESGLPENLMLSVGYNNIPLSTFPALDEHAMSNVSIGLSQKISMPGEAHYRKEGAYYRSLAAKEGYRNSWSIVRLQVAELYHDLLFLYEKKRLLVSMERALGDIVSVARALVSVNKMNSSQLLRLDADLSILRNRIIKTEGKIIAFEVMLEEMSGLKPQNMESQVWITKAGEVKLPADFDLSGHPLYKKSEFSYQVSEAMKLHAEAKAFPAVNLFAGYSFREPIAGKDTGEDFISFRVSVPLPAYYPVREAPAIEAAQKELLARQESLRAARLQLEAGWKAQKELSEKLLQVYANLESEVLPKYLASYQAQMGALSSGTVTLLDVLEAYRMYLNVSINHAETYRDLMKSAARLEYLSAPGEAPGQKPKEISDVPETREEKPQSLQGGQSVPVVSGDPGFSAASSDPNFMLDSVALSNPKFSLHSVASGNPDFSVKLKLYDENDPVGSGVFTIQNKAGIL